MPINDDRTGGRCKTTAPASARSTEDIAAEIKELLDPRRRRFLQGVSAVAAASVFSGAVAFESSPAAAATAGGKPIKIGFIEDFSGNLAIYGIQKLHAAQLAVAEINQGLTLIGGETALPGVSTEGKRAKTPPTIRLNTGVATDDILNDGGAQTESGLYYGEPGDILVPSGDKGLLGQPIQLVISDGQSENQLWQQLARKQIEGDKVDTLVAGFSSAEREAIRPTVDRAKIPYFYTNQYEGGVADQYTFCTGPVCEQQVGPVVEYLVRNFGPKGFTIASNYNFGQLTAAWTRAFAPLAGGRIIGEEFVPLSVSEFSQVISKVQQAKPDWLMMLTVSQSNSNYYPQAAAAGVKIPMGSTINMMQGYEHIRFKPPALANMHNAVQYMPELPTARNLAFLKRFFKMFPKDPYIGGMAENTYFTIHLYAKAVRLAGTTDKETVRKCLESGWSIEAPEGSVFLEPGTHHCMRSIRMAKADEQQNISFVSDWPAIEPWWLQRLGVNLVGHPLMKQFTPAEDPFFKLLQGFANKEKKM